MPYQEEQYLLKPTSSPATINFFQAFYNKFDIGAGIAHKKILNVEPIYFQGVIAGSEFLTYANTKLYLSISFFGTVALAASATVGFINFNDENDVLNLNTSNQDLSYNGAVANYVRNYIFIENFYFSRLLVQIYTQMIFNGFRITLT